MVIAMFVSVHVKNKRTITFKRGDSLFHKIRNHLRNFKDFCTVCTIQKTVQPQKIQRNNIKDSDEINE